MARNPVAANLAMATLLVGGLATSTSIRRELFPDTFLNRLWVMVSYPGATPTQIETSVAIPIEQAISTVSDVSNLSVSIEAGWTFMMADVRQGADPVDTINRVDDAIASLSSLPAGIERPMVRALYSRDEIITLLVHGNVSIEDLRRVAESIRSELLQIDGVSVVELEGLQDPRIYVEVPEDVLRRHGLSLADVAAAIRGGAVQVPGGRIDAPSGQVLLHVDRRRDLASEFGDVTLLSRTDGSRLVLGDVANLREGVENDDWGTYHEGQRAARIKVYRVGEERPLEISEAVRRYVAVKETQLPEGLDVIVWEDESEAYEARIDLLARNAMLGLMLVLPLLAAFLAPSVAFWVTLGIPISFLGTIALLPIIGVSINMISLFGFIVALGIVVDDAIVVGEAVHKHRTDGKDRLTAAIDGAREVARPVVFSVLTTIIAFVPIMFVPESYGQFFRPIPLIVIPAFAISLFESLFILPAHLAEPEGRLFGRGRLVRFQRRFSRSVEIFIERRYVPALRASLRHAPWAWAISIAFLVIVGGTQAGGHVRFNFFPKIERDTAVGGVGFPVGTPSEETRRALQRLEDAAHRVAEKTGRSAELVRGVIVRHGHGYQVKGGESQWGSHVGSVMVRLTELGVRPISAKEFSERWREEVGRLPGVDQLSFSFAAGFGGDAAVEAELSHADPEVLREAAAFLAERLVAVEGIVDVDDGFSRGKGQLDFELTPSGEAAGITYEALAAQLRGHYQGIEVSRQVRGQSEVRVIVRRPEEERRSRWDLESMHLVAPNGRLVPLREAATVVREVAPTRVQRRDGKRIIRVAADVEEAVITVDEVQEKLQSQWLEEVSARFPGVQVGLGQSFEARNRTLSALEAGFAVALFAMFALLAVASKSYLQPLLVVSAIPFGVAGAVVGHLILDLDLSLVSLLGMIALAGVVVNDSLVLVSAVNDRRAAGVALEDAVVDGARRRFRPILLTTLTTFFGLTPMIFEMSEQARFLSPMAVSLGFGVLTVTLFTLFVIPSMYVAMDRLIRRAEGEERVGL
ncbi:MAG: efflux RND transporter permease subunit [Myxococcales bacterium]|nr:efflux RND transporter permease subunit [Myxococcales bacterium]